MRNITYEAFFSGTEDIVASQPRGRAVASCGDSFWHGVTSAEANRIIIKPVVTLESVDIELSCKCSSRNHGPLVGMQRFELVLHNVVCRYVKT
jgi:hypothetical protein